MEGVMTEIKKRALSFGCREAKRQREGGAGDDGAAQWMEERTALLLRRRRKRILLNCSRQWGKSTLAAAMAVHRAWFHAGSVTLVLSPTKRQSGELVRKAAGLMQKLGIKRRGDGDNELSLLFPNGA